MSIEYFGVQVDPVGSQNYLRLKLGGDIPISRSCKIVIERPGQSRPFLAQIGWQSNYNKEVIDVLSSGAGTFDLCLPISLAKFLDSEHNYKIELLDMSDNSLGVFGMNWVPPSRILMAPIPTTDTEELLEPVGPVLSNDPILVAEPKPLSQPLDIETPIAARRTVEKCVYCGGQIFSTFIICPYCGTPFSVG